MKILQKKTNESFIVDSDMENKLITLEKCKSISPDDVDDFFDFTDNIDFKREYFVINLSEVLEDFKSMKKFREITNSLTVILNSFFGQSNNILIENMIRDDVDYLTESIFEYIKLETNLLNDLSIKSNNLSIIKKIHQNILRPIIKEYITDMQNRLFASINDAIRTETPKNSVIMRAKSNIQDIELWINYNNKTRIYQTIRYLTISKSLPLPLEITFNDLSGDILSILNNISDDVIAQFIDFEEYMQHSSKIKAIIMSNF